MRANEARGNVPPQAVPVRGSRPWQAWNCPRAARPPRSPARVPGMWHMPCRAPPRHRAQFAWRAWQAPCGSRPGRHEGRACGLPLGQGRRVAQVRATGQLGDHAAWAGRACAPRRGGWPAHGMHATWDGLADGHPMWPARATLPGRHERDHWVWPQGDAALLRERARFLAGLAALAPAAPRRRARK